VGYVVPRLHTASTKYRLTSQIYRVNPGAALINIFPTSNISDNGSSVQASAVLKLYDHLYDRIMQAGSQAIDNAEVQQLHSDITSLRNQLRTSNQSVLRLAANIAISSTSNDTTELSNPADGTAIDPKKLVALQKENYLIEQHLKHSLE
jgi:hypothetical protein